MAVAVKLEWPSLAETEANALALRKETEAALARLEAKFGFASKELPGKLASAEIAQTAEVCRWLLLNEILASVVRGEPA